MECKVGGDGGEMVEDNGRAMGGAMSDAMVGNGVRNGGAIRGQWGCNG